MSVQSTPGMGTTFKLSIPSACGGDVPLVNTLSEIEKHAVPVTQSLGHKLQGKVLLVEDNPENQKLLSLILSKMGATVFIADNGEEAVRKVGVEHFDLIFMDMQMPVMSGLEATRVLRRRGYEGAIIALTANATSEDRNACLQAGYNSYLTKPIHRDHLYEVTAQYLEEETGTSSELPIMSQLEDDDPELHSLLLHFVQGLPQVIAQLEHLKQQQDWQEFKKRVHDLKGAGGNFGYPTLSALSERILIELKQEHLWSVSELFVELTQQSARIYHGVFPKGVAQTSQSIT